VYFAGKSSFSGVKGFNLETMTFDKVKNTVERLKRPVSPLQGLKP